MHTLQSGPRCAESHPRSDIASGRRSLKRRMAASKPWTACCGRGSSTVKYCILNPHTPLATLQAGGSVGESSCTPDSLDAVLRDSSGSAPHIEPYTTQSSHYVTHAGGRRSWRRRTAAPTAWQRCWGRPSNPERFTPYVMPAVVMPQAGGAAGESPRQPRQPGRRAAGSSQVLPAR